jgi:chromosome segregation ATPase
MSGGELTKEQLLEYVKKQKIKIKKLETDIAALKETQSAYPDTTSIATSKESNEDLISEYLSRIEQLQNDLTRKEQENTSNQKKINELEKSLAEKSSGTEFLEEEISTLEKQISDLQVAQKQAQQSSNEELKRAHQQIEELTHVNQNLRQHTKECEEKLSSLQTSRNEESGQVTNLENKIQKMKEIYDKTIEQVNQLTQEITTKDELISQYERQHSTENDSKSKELTQLKEEKETRTKELNNLNDKLHCLQIN